MCRMVYGDIHLKNLRGSITRIGYFIPVLDFYVVLQGPFDAEKKHYNGLINLKKYVLTYGSNKV